MAPKFDVSLSLTPPMKFTVQEISNQVQGTIEGDTSVVITHPARIEDAQADSISFIAHPKYKQYAYSTKAGALLVNSDLKLEEPVASVLIRVADAYSAFSKVLGLFDTGDEDLQGISEFAFIAPTAKVAEDAYVGPLAYIGPDVVVGTRAKIYPQVYLGRGVKVGPQSELHPGVHVYRGCVIGQGCYIHAGAVIGSDGFGFAPQPDGTYQKIPQTGNVVIEDNVEIGANTTIDRATIGSTHIGKGVKLDNLVQIAHNVQIGENTVVAAQVGISGSTKIGKFCQIGGQAGLVGHIEIADYTRINAQSGVSKSIKSPKQAVTGSPAHDYTATLRAQAIFRRLPELEQRIAALEAKLEAEEKSTAHE